MLKANTKNTPSKMDAKKTTTKVAARRPEIPSSWEFQQLAVASLDGEEEPERD